MTIVHRVVLFRLREGVTLGRVREAREALSALVETLPGVLHLAVVENVASEADGYKLALVSGFENESALAICERHPEYRRVWEELLAPIVADRLEVRGTEG